MKKLEMRILGFAVLLAGCLMAGSADAQEVFRAVSPDGLNELRLDVGDSGMFYSIWNARAEQ